MKRLAVGVAILGLLLVGCKGKSIEGKWTATGSDISAKAVLHVAFAPPDKMTGTMDLPGSSGAKLHIVGFYKLEGDELTNMATDVSLEIAGPAADSAKRRFESEKAGMLMDLNESPKGKLVWIDNDKFTVTSGAKENVVTFTRVKK